MRAERLRLLPKAETAIQAQARRLVPPLIGSTGRLGTYWPLAGEADLRDVGPTLADRLALPVVERAAPTAGNGVVIPGRLLYRRWRPNQPLVVDSCGIPAPTAEEPDLAAADLALLLVPALAIDPRGYRLGYGGGWYDRLRSDPAWARVPALAVLPAGCCLQQLPHAPWDIPLAGWLNEDGLHWC